MAKLPPLPRSPGGVLPAFRPDPRHRVKPNPTRLRAQALFRDLPLFEAVGFPVAVNPETRLAAIARKRGWLVEHWSKAPGGPRPLLPIGPMMVERERRRNF